TTSPAAPAPQPVSTPATPGSTNQPAQAAPVVSRDTAIAATPRVKIDTPRLVGSISLTRARIDDLALGKCRETVDPTSPAVVLYSPSNAASPYYAEFGWVPASCSHAPPPHPTHTWD